MAGPPSRVRRHLQRFESCICPFARLCEVEGLDIKEYGRLPTYRRAVAAGPPTYGEAMADLPPTYEEAVAER